MKVFIVIKEWQYDTGDSGLNIAGTFLNKEEAQKCFKKASKDAKIHFNTKALNVSGSPVIEKDKDSFTISKEDNYSYNHFNVMLKEEEFSLNTEEDFYKDCIENAMERLYEDEDADFPKLSKKTTEKVVNDVIDNLKKDNELQTTLDETIEHYLWHHPLVMEKDGDK